METTNTTDKKRYELLIILSGKLQDSEVAGAIETVKSVFEKHGASVTNEAIWGRMKLAYEIKREKSGTYVLWTLVIDPSRTPALQADLTTAEHVVRFLLTEDPKHGKTIESPLAVAAREEAEKKAAEKEAEESAKETKKEGTEKSDDVTETKKLNKILKEDV